MVAWILLFFVEAFDLHGFGAASAPAITTFVEFAAGAAGSRKRNPEDIWGDVLETPGCYVSANLKAAADPPGRRKAAMDFESLQVLAGFASTAIFASSKVPMLVKALRTRDLHSYSLGHIGMSVSGNLIYWLYVISLPFGPIWVLQAFFTLSDFLMLACYVLFQLRKRRSTPKRRAAAQTLLRKRGHRNALSSLPNSG